ncbi:MAG TPA: NUDIX domain-containing protein [Acidimicrobiales bacterium]|nr:NUDIX domain-containing protein [Acidimicrobiales bacterium]
MGGWAGDEANGAGPDSGNLAPVIVGSWMSLSDLDSPEVGDTGAVVDALECLEVPRGEAENARLRTLAFVADHPDALHRSCVRGHLTGSAWVIDHTGTRGLILFHTKIRRWLQPGGHADADPDLARVALREATEETGIEGLEVWTAPVDVDVHTFVDSRGREPEHLHFDLRFAVRAPAGALERGNHESEALRWITAADLDDPELALDAGTVRLARAAWSLSA